MKDKKSIRSALLVVAALLTAVIATKSALGDDLRPTRLYVKSNPPGAQVTLDGKVIGQSDGLFEVAPGRHAVRVSLAGRQTVEHQVDVAVSQITRLELTLVAAPAEPDPGLHKGNGQGDAAEAVEATLRRANLAEPLRQAMITVVRQHPDELRWSGRSGDMLFGIAAKKLPADSKHVAIPALVELTQSLAVNELLMAKSVLDIYQETGLTDATTLRQSVVNAAGDLHVTGTTAGATQRAVASGGYASAFVIAADSSLRAHLAKAPQLEAVRLAYRDVMHRQARELMNRGDWKDAILLWRHLHQLRLVSQSLYLDAATCFKELGQPDDAVKILTEAVETFRAEGTEEFFEGAGNVALQIEGQTAQNLAVTAYKLASARLNETITGTTKKSLGLPPTTSPTTSN